MITIIKHGKYFNQCHFCCDVCKCEWVGSLVDRCMGNTASCPECGHIVTDEYTKTVLEKRMKESQDE